MRKKCLIVMTRDEWYNSVEFKTLRLFNQLSGDLSQTTQQLYDVLALILEKWPDAVVLDKFNLVERQLRIVGQESNRLFSEFSRLADRLSPHQFDDHTQDRSG